MRRDHTGAQFLAGWPTLARLALLSVLLLASAGGVSADGHLPLYFDWGPPLHDFHDLGGGMINPNLSCSNAHEQLAVAGFDRVGEWLEIVFTLAEGGDDVLSADFKSEDDQYNRLDLSLRPAAAGSPSGGEISYYGSGTD